MKIHFTKMHGLGNDFMMIDCLAQTVILTQNQVRQWSDRHLGIGFDQLLVVEPPTDPDMDFRYRIYNADGNEVEQCGNGARCFARFVFDNGLTKNRNIRVETIGGPLHLKIRDDGDVTVDMGPPLFSPEAIPFTETAEAKAYSLELANERVDISALSMGNPHAIVVVDEINTAPVTTVGAEISKHRRFPNGTNTSFMQILSRNEISLRTHERGVGETMACGTAACAAVVSGCRQGLLDNSVQVNLKGGRLWIQWAKEGDPVMMTGSATKVFEGQVEL